MPAVETVSEILAVCRVVSDTHEVWWGAKLKMGV